MDIFLANPSRRSRLQAKNQRPPVLSKPAQVGASKEHALKGAMLNELQKRLGHENVEVGVLRSASALDWEMPHEKWCL